jgi:citrate lyase subunit beta/citryl-CoA lyase
MRSLLFAGATRPDLLRKLPRSGPDAVVIDLEDAVPPSHKEAAREQAATLGAELASAQPELEVFVRVNPPGGRWFEDDIESGLGEGISGVVLPKVESAEAIERVTAMLERKPGADLKVIAGIETAAGVAGCASILAQPLAGAYFGAEDFIADLGGKRTPGGEEIVYARSKVALHARLNGVSSIDVAYVDVRDDNGFRKDAETGRAFGYRGKICLHPQQVEIANQAFGAVPEEVERARSMLAAAEEASRAGRGAIEFDGQMIDEPELRMARDVLARVAKAGAASGQGAG